MILLTGAKGFIGKNVKLPKDEKVRGYDKEVDISDYQAIMRLPTYEGVIHLAALSRVSWCKSDPEKCIRTNVLGTVNMLEYCKDRVAWLIFISSRGVAKLDTLYSISKHTGELMCYRYAKDYGMRIMILRLGDVVGPGNHKDKIVPMLMTGKKVQLYDEEQQFDLIPVSQVNSAICSAINKLRRSPPGFCERIEVTSGRLYSLKEIADFAMEIVL